MFDPYFDSVAAFIAMGEHGFFVWSAYGLSALLIVTNMLVAVRRQGRVRAEIARQARRDGARTSPKAGTSSNSVERNQ
ncbi:MAG: heme exporter protein CcmD [Alcanivorax sp.]|nr:heme exporter protein CcmD [Alcanivorax sp.]